MAGLIGPEQLSYIIDYVFKKEPEVFTAALLKASRMYAEREEKGGVRYEKAEGPRFYVSVKEAIGGSAGALLRSDSESFPTPVARSYIQPVDTLKRIVGVAAITLDEIEALDSEDAIIGKVDELFNDVRTAMKHVLRTSFMAAWKPSTAGHAIRTGWIGEITIGSSNVTVPAYGAGTVDLTLTADSDSAELFPGAFYFIANQIVDVYTASNTPSLRGKIIVHAVSPDRKTITVSSISTSFTLSANTTYDFYIANGFDALPNPYELIAADVGVLHGINRSTTPIWRGKTIDAETSSLSVALVQQAIDSVHNSLLEGPQFTEAYTTKKQLRALMTDILNTLNYQIQMQQDEDSLIFNDYFITFEGIKFFYDPYVPPGRCYIPALNTLGIKYLTDISPLGGEKTLYRVQKTDLFRTEWYTSRQQFCEFPAWNIKIVGLDGDIFST